MKLFNRIGFILYFSLILFSIPLEAQMKNINSKVAIFAGGCFWCMEPPFDAIPGVIETQVGYMGGTVPNPTYEMVSSGTTGHAEVVRVVYDPDKVSYYKLLKVFWKNI